MARLRSSLNQPNHRNVPPVIRFFAQDRAAVAEERVRFRAGVTVRDFDLGELQRGEFGSDVGFDFFAEPRLTPEAVDCLVPSRLDDPRARKIRDAGDRPLIHRGRKGFLRRLFREIEVAHEPNEDSNNPAPIGPIDRFHGGGGIHCHSRL